MKFVVSSYNFLSDRAAKIIKKLKNISNKQKLS